MKIKRFEELKSFYGQPKPLGGAYKLTVRRRAKKIEKVMVDAVEAARGLNAPVQFSFGGVTVSVRPDHCLQR